MAGINTRVVRRSNALMEYAYGKAFSYREVMALKRGFCLDEGTTATLGLGSDWFVHDEMTRPLLFRTILPRPGEGLSPRHRKPAF